MGAALLDPTSKKTTDVQAIIKGKKLGVYLWKTTVRIYNKLDNGLQLRVHCKSKDDDLGAHVLANDEFYEWKFRINFSGTTLFFCGLTWTGASGTFDIFKASRDKKRCTSLCNWRVFNTSVDGFRELDYSMSNADIHFTWPKP
ncbi:Self-incompatibility protein [Trema orientale]|uniref:S-protein homolog n=1 Tax=Trema orientale TaxID=63057 RepID=A0A2P5CYJ1_TREOI|nr:Self-incompatibility protein [Trema orientale]